MGFNVEKIFEDYDYLSKVKTKKDYEINSDRFKKDRMEYLKDLTQAEDLSQRAGELCQDVFDAFQKRGKIRGGDQMTLNYFMIYYVFPSILSECQNGNDVCDALKDAWNNQFKENISYTDYETLLGGFRTKIFGITIGK